MLENFVKINLDERNSTETFKICSYVDSRFPIIKSISFKKTTYLGSYRRVRWVEYLGFFVELFDFSALVYVESCRLLYTDQQHSAQQADKSLFSILYEVKSLRVSL